MTLKPTRVMKRLQLLLVVMLPIVAQGQFTFTTNNGAITITRYTGPGGIVVIPDTTNGWPVETIGQRDDTIKQFGQSEIITGAYLRARVH